MTDMPRPPKWDDWLPEGSRLPDDAWEVRPDDRWIIEGGRTCRYGSPRYGFCGRPSVATLLRGRRRPARWAYCERHLYGRWIEAGRVVDWVVRKEDPS